MHPARSIQSNRPIPIETHGSSKFPELCGREEPHEDENWDRGSDQYPTECEEVSCTRGQVLEWAELGGGTYELERITVL